MPELGFNFTPFPDGVAVNGADINAALTAFAAAVANGAIDRTRLDKGFRLPNRYCSHPAGVHFYSWTNFDPNLGAGATEIYSERSAPGPMVLLNWMVGLHSAVGAVGNLNLDLVGVNASEAYVPLENQGDQIQVVQVTPAASNFQRYAVQTQNGLLPLRLAEDSRFALRVQNVGAAPTTGYEGLSVAIAAFHRHVSVRD